ncbi:hypothetical protein CR513_14243, partial [Mucuna pruriens]
MYPTLQETESNHPKSVGAIGVWKATISAKAKSRAICSSAIRTYTKCTSRLNKLSTTNSTIPSTAIPAATTTTKSASSRQLAISRGPNEAISYKQPRSVGSSNLPSQTIPNPRGNASAFTLRSGKELPQPAPQQLLRSTDADSKSDADS